MKALILVLLSTVSFLSQASADVFVKKLIDQETQTTLFLACQSETHCRVLAGGSFSKSELETIISKLRTKHYLENAAIIGGATVSVALNPVAMMGFLSVPAGLITFVGASAYVYFQHEEFESHKRLDLVSNESSKQFTSEELLELIEKDFLDLRR